ncbi:hypothetical protein KHQ81_12525 [Mycoplasmatota bacterium]|nr:hypothetical protein KHQ81_12525 [Mycoplasmatota bacterium]
MVYGITKSHSTILSNISDALDEKIKKINTVERLSRISNQDLSLEKLYQNYMKEINKVIGDEPIIMVIVILVSLFSHIIA